MGKKRFGLRALVCLLAAVCLMQAYMAFMRQKDGQETVTVKDYETQKIAAGLTQEALAQSAKEQSLYYAYRSLTEEEQTLYTEILMILTRMEEDIIVSALQEEPIDKVFQCVMYDHPELFFVEGYQITKYTVEEEVKRITFRGTYAYTKEEAESRKEKIAQYVSRFFAGMPVGTDEYEKVKYIYEYLIRNTAYDLQAKENQTICSVFLYGASVCQGYAKAMQYLCQQAGIEAALVLGSVENGEGHAWNLVKVDGAYYYVDATWGDAFYAFAPGQMPNGRLPSINYDYLCVTTQQLCKTHTIDMEIALPRCIAVQANYYVREGAYFESADMEKVKALFERAYERQQETMTLKCASEEVYAQLKQLLIKEQQIFQYVEIGEKSIAYTENAAQLTLSFWL